METDAFARLDNPTPEKLQWGGRTRVLVNGKPVGPNKHFGWKNFAKTGKTWITDPSFTYLGNTTHYLPWTNGIISLQMHFNWPQNIAGYFGGYVAPELIHLYDYEVTDFYNVA